jgi:hypothetical protein
MEVPAPVSLTRHGSNETIVFPEQECDTDELKIDIPADYLETNITCDDDTECERSASSDVGSASFINEVGEKPSRISAPESSDSNSDALNHLSRWVLTALFIYLTVLLAFDGRVRRSHGAEQYIVTLNSWNKNRTQSVRMRFHQGSMELSRGNSVSFTLLSPSLEAE